MWRLCTGKGGLLPAGCWPRSSSSSALGIRSPAPGALEQGRPAPGGVVLLPSLGGALRPPSPLPCSSGAPGTSRHSSGAQPSPKQPLSRLPTRGKEGARPAPLKPPPPGAEDAVRGLVRNAVSWGGGGGCRFCSREQPCRGVREAELRKRLGLVMSWKGHPPPRDGGILKTERCSSSPPLETGPRFQTQGKGGCTEAL